MSMTLDKLLPALRQVGIRYLTEQKGMFRNNQDAAEILKKLLMEATGKTINEEVLQKVLLTRLSRIFLKMKSSTVLLTNIKDKLLEYEPFKPLVDYLPEKGTPSPAEMSLALDRLAIAISSDYDLKCNLALAAKADKVEKLELKV